MDSEDTITQLAPLTRAHYSRLRFYWVNRGRAPNQGTSLELDLHRWGYLAWRDNSYGANYVITEAGAHALALESERSKARRAPHDELAGRVAQYLQAQGRMTWQGVEFIVREQDVTKRAAAMAIDVSADMGLLFAAPRPDVFSVVPTHTESRINPVVHEVKVTRADFLADLAKPLKRLAYACIAETVYYAAPAGVIAPEEVPKNCGLLVELSPGEFKIAKRARKHPVTLTASHFMNLVIKPGTSLHSEPQPVPA